MRKIILKSFSVDRIVGYRSDGGKISYEVSARFVHGQSDFTIRLGKELGEMIVTLCRGKISEASCEAIEALRLDASEVTDGESETT